MDTTSRFEICLNGLPAEGITRHWALDDSFFSALDEQEIEHGNLDATLRVEQKSGTFVFTFDVQGTIQATCDRCLAPMSVPIETQQTLEVKLGETFEDDGELITIPADHPTLDVAWNLYEVIALAIPIYHAHPEGECESTMDDLLRQHNAETAQHDTRWDALKGLFDKDQDNNK